MAPVHLFITAMVITHVIARSHNGSMGAMNASHDMTKECDVVVAGGSLASAAAAVAAGEASNLTRVCFLEITDWPGGQASASGIPAMDFGLNYVNFPQNIPRSLAELLTDGKIGGPNHSPNYNPGECQYLPKCFAPSWAAEWLLDRLAALPNVTVFLNTAVVGVSRDAIGRVTMLRAVQRTPTVRHPSGWDRPLSRALPDWYSTTPSAYFDKTQLQFVVAPAGVVVEATEFGDVLVLAEGVAVGQGVELGTENNTKYDEHCGNPAAFTVFAAWGSDPLPPNTTVAGKANTAQSLPAFLKVRRYWTAANHTPQPYNPYHRHPYHSVGLARGDHYTVTDNCNDLANAQVFLPMAIARSTARAGAWAGGMNLTALAMAEALAWTCYHAIEQGILSVRPEEAGTSNGLAKMPYLRESRRSMAGVGGFRLCHNVMSAHHTGPGGRGCATAADPPGRSGNGTGYRFLDTVGVGAPQPLFGYDVHEYPRKWCSYPAYMRTVMRIPNSTVPFYIPFRALTVASAPNMLVAGKSMATSFLASAITRLHPNEWASGTAAGVAAVMMSALNLSAAQMAVNVSSLQDRLLSLGVPLTFNLTFE